MMLGYPVSPLPRATMQTGPGVWGVPQFAGVSWCAEVVQPQGCKPCPCTCYCGHIFLSHCPQRGSANAEQKS